MTPKPDTVKAERMTGGAGPASVRCPGCGGQELVRAYLTTNLGFARREGARCLVCGKRFVVAKQVFAALRQPVLGEPYETFSDKYRYMGTLPMGRLHIAICLGGLIIGVALGVTLGERFDQPALVAVFLPVNLFFFYNA